MQSIVFGPIYSRRFGVSLGVDLSPHKKQCNFDCLYCELGGAKTIEEMQESLPKEEILQAILPHLNEKIDVLTITATGEPTLYPEFLPLSLEIQKLTRGHCKTLILSNGSKFGDKTIAQGLHCYDIVKFSLDCISPACFKKLDRPNKKLNLEEILEGIESFAKSYQGELVCEVLVIQGINDTLGEMKKIADFCKKIGTHRIDLGSLDRPGAYRIQGVDTDKLYFLSEAFDGQCVSIPTRKILNAQPLVLKDKEDIASLLMRRPLSCEEVKTMLDQKSNEMLKEMVKNGEILIKNVASLDFYVLKS